jgi:hypothetical protein
MKMQAASTVRGIGISRQGAGFVVGLMAALLLGGTAGFMAKSLTAGQTGTASKATVTIAHQQAPDAVDRNAERLAPVGGPQSDLTRALPKAAPVVAPKEIPGRQFGVPEVTTVPGSEYSTQVAGNGEYYIP